MNNDKSTKVSARDVLAWGLANLSDKDSKGNPRKWTLGAIRAEYDRAHKPETVVDFEPCVVFRVTPASGPRAFSTGKDFLRTTAPVEHTESPDGEVKTRRVGLGRSDVHAGRRTDSFGKALAAWQAEVVKFAKGSGKGVCVFFPETGEVLDFTSAMAGKVNASED